MTQEINNQLSLNKKTDSWTKIIFSFFSKLILFLILLALILTPTFSIVTYSNDYNIQQALIFFGFTFALCLLSIYMLIMKHIKTKKRILRVKKFNSYTFLKYLLINISILTIALSAENFHESILALKNLTSESIIYNPNIYFIHPEILASLLIFSVVLFPLSIEIIFRAMMYERLKKKSSSKIANLIVSVIFITIQTILFLSFSPQLEELVWIIAMFITSLVLTRTYEKTNTICSSIFLNMLMMSIYFLHLIFKTHIIILFSLAVIIGILIALILNRRKSLSET